MRRFDFHAMNLIPKKCIVGSRSECDTSMKILGNKFCLPVVPANMACVINDSIAMKLARSGHFYIHNRFTTNILEFSKKMVKEGLPLSISIGVNDADYELLKQLYDMYLYPRFSHD